MAHLLPNERHSSTRLLFLVVEAFSRLQLREKREALLSLPHGFMRLRSTSGIRTGSSSSRGELVVEPLSKAESFSHISLISALCVRLCTTRRRVVTHACAVRPWVVWACRWLLVRVQPGCDAQLQAGRRAPHYARRSHHVCEYQAFGSRALRVLARPPDSVLWHRPRRATCG